MAVPVGTLKSIFNRTYVLTTPSTPETVPEWRPTNVPIEADSIAIIALLPLQAQENVNTGVVDISFYPLGLNEISGTETNTYTTYDSTATYYTNWTSAGRQNFSYFPQARMVQAGETIKGIAPIHDESIGQNVVLTFSPWLLPRVEDIPQSTYGGRRNVRAVVKSYNDSNALSLSATDPITLNVDGTVTQVGFDPYSLPRLTAE